MKGTCFKSFKYNYLWNESSASSPLGGKGLKKSLFRSRAGRAISGTARSRRLVLFWNILLGSLFIALGAVIGLIKTASFEEHSCPSGDHTPDFGFSAFRTFLDGLVAHGLVFLESVLARPTFILISRHR